MVRPSSHPCCKFLRSNCLPGGISSSFHQKISDVPQDNLYQADPTARQSPDH